MCGIGGSDGGSPCSTSRLGLLPTAAPMSGSRREYSRLTSFSLTFASPLRRSSSSSSFPPVGIGSGCGDLSFERTCGTSALVLLPSPSRPPATTRGSGRRSEPEESPLSPAVLAPFLSRLCLFPFNRSLSFLPCLERESMNSSMLVFSVLDQRRFGVDWCRLWLQ